MSKTTKYKELLLKGNVRQNTVAEATKISHGNLNLFANGYSNPTMETLRRLVVFHRVSPNDILDWERWIEEADEKDLKARAKKK